ncbi:MAG: hypothetical protein HXS52_11935 [Theionarchaea archaeon]|nr:hypothetical protein [Theionarchaea archaeon]MBU7038631.1 hypothetical protein [Theionarchaea archaeon]
MRKGIVLLLVAAVLLLGGAAALLETISVSSWNVVSFDPQDPEGSFILLPDGDDLPPGPIPL